VTTNLKGATKTNRQGIYVFPLIPPGTYHLTVHADGYQAREFNAMQVSVGSRVELNFPLRLLTDTLEEGAYSGLRLPANSPIVTLFGGDMLVVQTDLDLAPNDSALQSGVSAIIDLSQLGGFSDEDTAKNGNSGSIGQPMPVSNPTSAPIAKIPLSGRDVYALLITQPGVTADTSTGRGLEVSANGQRPSSSSFLLDGVENNNYLLSGALTVVPPEAVQEYSVATNNFSAEFGRTTGVVANAITRSGGNVFHGLLYSYFGNDALNANAFDRNWRGLRRRVDKELYLGYSVGGPILKNRLFFWSAFEQFRSRSQNDPVLYLFPSSSQLNNASASDPGRQLLAVYPPPSGTLLASGLVAQTISSPISIDRSLATERIDYLAGKNQVTGRFTLSRQSNPDLFFSPYKGFNSSLYIDSYNLAFSYIRPLTNSIVNEVQFAWQNHSLGWTRPHPEIPAIQSLDGVTLPGTPTTYEYSNNGNGYEFADRFVLRWRGHVLTAGGGAFLLRSDSLFSYLRDGVATYQDLNLFLRGIPSSVIRSVGFDFSDTGSTATSVQPDYTRVYAHRDPYTFLQDNFRLGGRLALSLGVRYEFYGRPRSLGFEDNYILGGPGQTTAEQIAGARLVIGDPKRRHPLWPNQSDWAGRFGVSYNLHGQGSTLLRAGYGTFYDRLFDLLTQSLLDNSLALAFRQTLGTGGGPSQLSGPVNLTWIDPHFRSPLVQSWFVAFQQRAGSALDLELTHMGSIGRKLIATDLVNRFQGLYQLNPQLGEITYLSNSGASIYQALGGLVRYHSRRVFLQAAYTYSHSIDNQSDPFRGLLAFPNLSTAGTQLAALFTRQLDWKIDRGNSDFDQRHSLVLYSTWTLPSKGHSWLAKLGRGWDISELAGFRAGFPYTVYDLASGGAEGLLNNRPDYLGKTAPTEPIQPVPGSVSLLKPSWFAPAPNGVGSVGRNSFRGPGFWSVDLSINRTIAISESVHMQIRADAFNAFNHTNLNNPDVLLGDPGFGVATYGRAENVTAFASLTPFTEPARTIQLQLKVHF
jgi:hypothetical protein